MNYNEEKCCRRIKRLDRSLWEWSTLNSSQHWRQTAKIEAEKTKRTPEIKARGSLVRGTSCKSASSISPEVGGSSFAPCRLHLVPSRTSNPDIYLPAAHLKTQAFQRRQKCSSVRERVVENCTGRLSWTDNTPREDHYGASHLFG